jgi:mono/diheme cytochrome c family protein
VTTGFPRTLRPDGLRALVLVVAALAVGLPALAQDGSQESGEELYGRLCASCHLAEGEGVEDVYPALDGSAVVTGEPGPLVRQILLGGGGMPSFAESLDDGQLARVTSYLRSAWSNDAPPVEADAVAEVRAEADAPAGPEPADDGDGAAAAEAADFAWQELGTQVYDRSCAACHQGEGQGIPGVYPALAGSGYVQGDAVDVVETVANGRAGMPAFGDDLGNEALAAVLSYIRNTWGNQAPIVTPSFVEDVRGGATDVAPTDPTYRPGAAN